MDSGCVIATFKGGLEMRWGQKIFPIDGAVSDACGHTFCVKGKVVWDENIQGFTKGRGYEVM